MAKLYEPTQSPNDLKLVGFRILCGLKLKSVGKISKFYYTMLLLFIFTLTLLQESEVSAEIPVVLLKTFKEETQILSF